MSDISPLLPFIVQQLGSSFCIKVVAGARRNDVQLECKGDIKMRVYVTERAEQGRANRAVLKALACALGVSVSRLDIIRGQTSSIKLIRVLGV